MNKRPNVGKIPFADGHMVPYLGYLEWQKEKTTDTKWQHGPEIGTPIEWRDPIFFYASLRPIHYTRGRSKTIFILADPDGKTYHMMVSDWFKYIEQTEAKGTLTGMWKIVQRGANYRIKYLGGIVFDASAVDTDYLAIIITKGNQNDTKNRKV